MLAMEVTMTSNRPAPAIKRKADDGEVRPPKKKPAAGPMANRAPHMTPKPSPMSSSPASSISHLLSVSLEDQRLAELSGTPSYGLAGLADAPDLPSTAELLQSEHRFDPSAFPAKHSAWSELDDPKLLD